VSWTMGVDAQHKFYLDWSDNPIALSVISDFQILETRARVHSHRGDEPVVLFEHLVTEIID
jgi:hypothetical protein